MRPLAIAVVCYQKSQRNGSRGCSVLRMQSFQELCCLRSVKVGRIATAKIITFEPGAAHMSTTCRDMIGNLDGIEETQFDFTLWCGWTSRNSGGSMLTASCLEILPCYTYHKLCDSIKRITYDFCLMYKERVKFFECLLPSENFLGNIELPGQAFWIPS